MRRLESFAAGRLAGLVAAVAGALVTPMASAATAHVETADGLAVEVREVRHLPGRWIPGTSALAPGGIAGLEYDVREANGSTWTGMVPGSGSSATALTPTLAVDPVTGDVLLVVAVAPLGGEDGELRLASWTGQGFSTLETLRSSLGPALTGHAPTLGFRSDGSAVLAWRELDGRGGSELRIRHFALSPAGESELHSYYDLGSLGAHVPSAGPEVEHDDVRAWLVPEGTEREAWIVLDDTEGGGSAVLAIDLESDDVGTGGMGVAPVPVTFARDVTHADEGARHEQGGGVGRWIESHRLVAGDREAIYWTDGGQLHVLPLVGAAPFVAASPLVGPAPRVEELTPVVVLRRLRALEAGVEGPRERRRRAR